MKLYYKKYGNGYPLIILHALYGSSDNWTSIAKSVSNRFTVILPDLRNHGRSPHSPVHDYPSMSEDVRELADDLNLEKFFLAGHSMGGKTAIHFALKYPERLDGLMIVDISPFTNEKHSREFSQRHREILNAMTGLRLAEISSREEADLLLGEKITSDRTRGLIMKNLYRDDENRFRWRLNPHSLLANLKNIMEGFERTEAVKLQITGFPVIFLKGEKSEYLQEDDFKDIAKLFPSAVFVTVPGAGHWINADNPEFVRESLLRLVQTD
ncbi:MAG: alpha/beta fold hydrolase [Bacteroidales bacterium]|nr:alpha/beta fold hydrolase [Bacteroidales bacterium]